MTTLRSTFVPGEKTLFYDDFTDMTPARVYFPGRDPIGERIWFDSFSPKEH